MIFGVLFMPTKLPIKFKNTSFYIYNDKSMKYRVDYTKLYS